MMLILLTIIITFINSFDNVCNAFVLKWEASKSTQISLSPLSSCNIITCASNIELERAVSFYVKEKDIVLEFGSQLGDTTKHLCRQIGSSGRATLVDIKRSQSKTGRNNRSRNEQSFMKLPSSTIGQKKNTDEEESFIDRVTFVELDQLNDWKTSKKDQLFPENDGERCSYDVMILDIGSMIGNDLYLSTLSLTYELLSTSHAFRQQKEKGKEEATIHSSSSPSYYPRVVIVKSVKLCALARRLVNSQRLLVARTITLPESICRSSEPYIIPCVGVEEYRRTIPFTIRKGDYVLEVGCHFGRTTNMLHNAACSNHMDDEMTKAKDSTVEDNAIACIRGNTNNGYCIGVDIGSKIIDNAKGQYPHLSFEVGDAWKTLELLQMKMKKDEKHHGDKNLPAASSLGYDVVYADIGGLSGSDGLLESLSLLDSLGNTLKPRCIVIKSLCMKRLSSNLIAFSDIWINKISETKFVKS